MLKVLFGIFRCGFSFGHTQTCSLLEIQEDHQFGQCQALLPPCVCDCPPPLSLLRIVASKPFDTFLSCFYFFFNCMFVSSEIMLQSLNFLSFLWVLNFVAFVYCVAVVLEIKPIYSLVHFSVLWLSNNFSSNDMVIW